MIVSSAWGLHLTPYATIKEKRGLIIQRSLIPRPFYPVLPELPAAKTNPFQHTGLFTLRVSHGGGAKDEAGGVKGNSGYSHPKWSSKEILRFLLVFVFVFALVSFN